MLDGQAIVLEDYLVVHEPKARVSRNQIEHAVDRVDEAAAKLLEIAIPLAIPVEVRDEQSRFGHAAELRR